MKNRIHHAIDVQSLLVFIGLAMLFSTNLLTAQDSTQVSIFDEMSYAEVLDLTIKTEVDSLINFRRSERAYPSSVSFVNQDGERQTFKTKIQIRGTFRRARCIGIPPVKINFKKKALTKAGYSKFDDYKLVTYCVEDDRNAKALLLKEYLAYKFYNRITDQSYRVQLLKILFEDQQSGEKTQQWGFLIEDTALMRNRLGVKKVAETRNVSFEKFQLAQIRRVALFQYMIGNSDWDLSISRNVKFVSKDGQYLAIPYDFDFSGLVDAPYASGNPNYNLRNVRDRVYLGFPEPDELLVATVEELVGKQVDLIEEIRNFEYLSRDAQRDIMDYLEDYFSEPYSINRPKKRNQRLKIGE